MERVNELHYRLKMLRKESRLTQKQVAEYLGVDVSAYAHYEKGDRTPDAKKLARLANLYKLDDEMLGAQFPIETFVTYRKQDIEKLRQVLKSCDWRKGEYEYNKWQYEQLRNAVEPVLRAREEALSLPKIDLNILPVEGDVVKVKLDRIGEALIECYLRESQKFFHMV